MTLAAARAFLEHLIGELDEVVALGSSALTIGATSGLARIEQPGSGEEIMRRADLALYRGKEQGRGHVVCSDEQIETRQTERQRAIVRQRAALNEGRAIAAYQPIVELGSGRIGSLEALLGPEVRIGINLSEADLRKDDFVHHLIEVAETMLLDASGQLRDSLAMLDACGFTICLDDFGSDFSSLTHLRQFPIHKVKIDRDFIAGIAHDHQSRLIIKTIVQMGHNLGLRVVVEGVETEEQENFLRAIGCRHVQGYRYGRPMLIEELQSRLGPAQDEPWRVSA